MPGSAAWFCFGGTFAAGPACAIHLSAQIAWMIAGASAAVRRGCLTCGYRRNAEVSLRDTSAALAVTFDVGVVAARVERIDRLQKAVCIVGVSGSQRRCVVVIEIVNRAAGYYDHRCEAK